MTVPTALERRALKRIAGETDPPALRNTIANARRLGSVAVERAAFLRLCEVLPAARHGTVEHDVWRSVHALEEMLRNERGKTVRLSRTRQKIARDGEAGTAADLALQPEASAGFGQLLDRGHPELAFEAVVLRHPSVFAPEVTQAARARLSDAALDPDAFTPKPTGA